MTVEESVRIKLHTYEASLPQNVSRFDVPNMTRHLATGRFCGAEQLSPGQFHLVQTAGYCPENIWTWPI